MTMPIPVDVVTIDPLPTVVIAQTTSWEQFPYMWPKLLDEVYVFVRACRDFAAADNTTPIWEIYGHWCPDPDELETEVYHLLR
jgi:hypothetical protein